MTRVHLFALALAAALAAPLTALPVAAQQNPTRQLTVPVTGTVGTDTVFEGDLTIRSFVREGDTIYAVGTLSGVLTLADETTRNVVRPVRLPVNLDETTVTGAAVTDVSTQQAACEILHLELGPLDLDLLGLQVHLDEVVLDIQAEPGPGNLLGNLLCAIAGLLDPNPLGPLNQIVALLNQILALLG
jgi:hypothetical protein